MNDKRRRIAIVGAGELGQQIAHLGLKNGYRIVGFFDDWTDSATVMNLPVFGKLSDIDKNNCHFDALILGVGYKHFEFRKSFFDEFCSRYEFASIIDDSAVIDPTACVGKGCVIYPNVTLDKDVCIGEDVILNISCTICHNSIIGSHSYIAPAVNIAGYVNVGEMVFLGIGATVMDDLSICDKTVIGAQTLVNQVITNKMGGVYVGVPARKIIPQHGL